jgi:serine/threonine protein kinase
VDVRADIYSLGCTLYRLLAGRVPFPEGTRFQKLEAHRTRQPVPLNQLHPEVPVPLTEVLNMMLAKTPERRPRTPLEVARAMEPFCRGARLARLLERSPAHASPSLSTQPFPAPSPISRRPWLLLAVLGRWEESSFWGSQGRGCGTSSLDQTRR